MTRTIRDVLRERAEPGQVAQVEDLVEHAAALLARIPDTLPTYTLHDRRHAENVITLMERLLGERVERLSALEAAMLILSAYFHDVGMVFTEAERLTLRDASDFGEYLRGHPGAALAVSRADDGVLPPDVAEGYCRWAHPERVAEHLRPERLRRPLSWDGIDLAPHLAAVCRSHGRDVKDLYDDDRFPTDFLVDCDLRLCALLLRLADIMDFDRSRTPEAVYEYLGLTDSTAPRERASDRAWRRHYSSTGFRFPADRDVAGYALDFVAGPDDPGVERDIREFLDVIEEEFRACERLRRTCADRWRDLPLPATIRRDNIRGQGYTYGPYRFEMSRSEVLRLFTGENLYESPYAFVRELLQNALDTSRDRAFTEEARTGRPFTPGPVRLRDWRDSQGRLWVEFADEGRGMDEHILLGYFLQIGRSYYTSEEFEAELLSYEYGRGREFLPISRFGVGVLSCFIVADRVELSTLRAAPGARPIRLSMWGRDGFYALQTPPQQAAPKVMPGPDGDEAGYRTVPGTTIAVRFDARRERGDFNLGEELRGHAAYPEVPVEYDGERVGGDPARLIDHCALKPINIEWPELRDELTYAFEELGLSEVVNNSLSVWLTPIDLSAASPSPDCRGQLVGVHLEGIRWGEISQLLSESRVEISFRLSQRRDMGLVVDVERHYETEDQRLPSTIASPTLELGAVLESHPVWREHLRTLLSLSSWSHNGVCLPMSGVMNGDLFSAVGAPSNEATEVCVLGHLSLRDRLRPEVDVSRDIVREIPWETRSLVTLAYQRAIRAAGLSPSPKVNLMTLPRPSAGMDLDLRTFLADRMLHEDDQWPSELTITTSEGPRSIRELSEGIEIELALQRALWFRGSVPKQCGLALLALRVRLVAVQEECSSARDAGWRVIVAETVRRDPISPGELLFPPLTFITIEGCTALHANNIGVNRDHRLARWLLTHAAALDDRYPAIFAALRSEMVPLSRSFLFDTATANRKLRMINTLLDRLAALDPDLRPPPSLRLQLEDLHVRRAGEGG